MTEIPIADPEVSASAIDRVHAVLEEGQLADGPEVRAFERAFANFCGVRHGVATSNGTTALHAALEALGVEAGDAVLTSPFSFVASANAIRLAGATPVFADIDPATYALDPRSVENVLRRRDDVVGLMPVHLYGLPAPMPELLDLAEEHDLFVLEDACQAHGSEIDGQRVGSFGDAACFSFYPTKNMTTGEGGIITTDDDDVAARAAAYINHGRCEDGAGDYEHRRLGHNYRLTSLAAAIGRVQLESLPARNRARMENARVYDEHLEELRTRDGEWKLRTPHVPRGTRHVYHQYTIRVEDRDELHTYLNDRGIGAGIYYPTPIHRQPAYEGVATAATDLPQAEFAAESVLSLPVHPNLEREDLLSVVDAIAAFYEPTNDLH
ncbi:DegT/DnrJ/EryC1/StrS family aminotransferase [Natronobiforma cellulositropha]|uniref:DegT/DnrJ/EryC1/StrS family aminotransferase n=1 Tax=Natronobiforma cellulositropha TaxID=1679076 RepID=UPI0021D5E5CF|nr:DegT/DnrJ/EryC1/StrS family aminotransferase [Natronobiforma cellulositropha]